MDFDLSPRQSEWLGRVRQFMVEHVYPAVPTYYAQLDKRRWQQPDIL